MQYIFLIGAIMSEITATTALKLSDGFSKLGPSIVVVVGYGLSFVLLSLALKRMGIGTAYAIWSGVGTAVITLIGIVYFKEPVTLLKLTSIALIIIGVVGLNVGER